MYILERQQPMFIIPQIFKCSVSSHPCAEAKLTASPFEQGCTM